MGIQYPYDMPDVTSWMDLLTRHEQEQLERRMQLIEAATAKALNDLVFQALGKGKCSTCGRWPETLQSTRCPCGGKVNPWKHFESEAKRLESKRLYDLNSLFKAYQIRVPYELGGDMYAMSKLEYYTTGWMKRKTVDKAKRWYSGWKSKHKKAASRLETSYGVGKGLKETLYDPYSTVYTTVTFATKGSAFSAGGLASQMLGQWVVAAATGPAGAAIVAYSVFSLVDNLGGKLWTYLEGKERWDAATGALTTRLGRVVKQFFASDIFKAYYKRRVGLDQVVHYENLLIEEYNTLRGCYVQWDGHRRELVKQANQLGLAFGKAVRLAREAEAFIDRTDPKLTGKGKQDPAMKGADRKAAKQLVKDCRKELEKLYKQIEEIIKDLNTRGTKTLNDLNAKLYELHNHGQKVSEQRKRWYKDEQGEHRSGKGVEIVDKSQIESRLAIPANERWIGGFTPDGKLDQLDKIDTHGFQEGWLEWLKTLGHRI